MYKQCSAVATRLTDLGIVGSCKDYCETEVELLNAKLHSEVAIELCAAAINMLDGHFSQTMGIEQKAAMPGEIF
eukprot:7619998-Pyramimonas_sp.AAC.1